MTNCNYCDYKAYNRQHCNKHSAEIPPEYMKATTCPDWEFDEIPF